MTGADVKQQVREALDNNAGDWEPEHTRRCDAALAALDGCVVLTAEEAEYVKTFLYIPRDTAMALRQGGGRSPLTLLTPEETQR